MNRKNISIWTVVATSVLACGLAIAQEPQADDPGRGGHDDGKGRRMEHRGQRGPMGPEQMVRMLNRHLELDETQTAQVENIMEAAKPEFDALRQKGMANRQAKQDLDADDPDYDAKMQNITAASSALKATATELRGRIRADVDAVLTPEQREKLAEAPMRGRKQGQRNRSGSGPGRAVQ